MSEEKLRGVRSSEVQERKPDITVTRPDGRVVDIYVSQKGRSVSAEGVFSTGDRVGAIGRSREGVLYALSVDQNVKLNRLSKEKNTENKPPTDAIPWDPTLMVD